MPCSTTVPATAMLAVACLAAGAAGQARAAQSEPADVLAPAGQSLVSELVRSLEPRQEGEKSVWEYELVVTESELLLADGTRYKVWAFGGTVPGPTLLAREGDWVRITLVNETSTPHTLHSHGLLVPHRMDGVPHALGGEPGGSDPAELPPWTYPVQPGEETVYEYIARPAGTHFYHCHNSTPEHLDRGMSGVLIVLPREPEPPVDLDVVWLLDEWNSDFARQGVPGNPRELGRYDFFTINGASFPRTRPLRVPLGGVVRLRIVNAGALAHSMHLHGHTFLVTHKDGQPLAEPLEMDTVPVAPGERVDLLIAANNPGMWPFHCHSAPHVTNAGKYPGGMLSRLLVGDEAFPRGGEGPVGEGLDALRQAWRRDARRRLSLGSGGAP